jgi:hypothetical protein
LPFSINESFCCCLLFTSCNTRNTYDEDK